MKTQFPPFVHAYPAPVVLIGCGTLAAPNLITCSWFGTVCSEPPMVSLAVRGSRFSYHLIQESGEFTVNVPRAADLPAVIHCGSVSGRSARKFDDLGLTAAACPPLERAPMIAEFPLALACRVRHTHELGTHAAFIAEVVGVHGCARSSTTSPRPDLFPEEQLVYLDGTYWSLRPVE
ncbi:MAG: flavin reductase family protein [bacterium]|nr:flavin reductase family protein [bacterium]